MSLKAKLEAVIYASEEPVTLAQLAALFAEEALRWKAERDAAAQEQAAEVLAPSTVDAGNAPLLSEAFAYLETDRQQGETSAAPGNSGVEPKPETAPDAGELDAEAAPEAGAIGDGSAAAEGESQATDEAAAEEEARQAARLRERVARGVMRRLLDELIAEYAVDARGIEIREIAGGYRMATKPECHDAVRSFVKSRKPPLKLSMPALETLAVIAYKQPVTAPEVNEIRGVDSSGVFGSLLARKLITTAGRKPVIGRPILYKTTREFLLRFGLKDVSELPSMEEFEKMAASELEEPEAAAGTETSAPAQEEFTPQMGTEQDPLAQGGEARKPASESYPKDSAQREAAGQNSGGAPDGGDAQGGAE